MLGLHCLKSVVPTFSIKDLKVSTRCDKDSYKNQILEKHAANLFLQILTASSITNRWNTAGFRK